MIELTEQTLIDVAYTLLERLALIIAIMIPAHIIIRVLNAILARFFDWTTFEPTLEKFIHKTTITLMWLITGGIILVVLGVDVSAVVASFGVGSFIVGFALKDTLNNFASGVMVLMNHPFKVGDDMEVKGARGIVKSISMSYTKLKTPEDVKVTIPNSIVWGNPIRNYSAYKGL